MRHAEQQLRGTLMLPHGTGKDTRVAVFAEGEKAKEAQEAGADVVGSADLADADRGRLRRLRRHDRDAGHDGNGRQARPHPRPARQDAEPEGRHGDLRRRRRRSATPRPASSSTGPTAARTSICRCGKKSFDERQLLENYATVLDEIVRAKPAAAKGRYIRSVTLASSMGPGIKVDPSRTRDVVEELEEAPAEAVA